MANLVSPGYDKSRLINSILSPYEERTLEFRGLNRRSYVEEGEMSDMRNMTSDGYPLLKPRALRRFDPRQTGVVEIYSIMGKYDKVAMIVKKSDDSIAFYYDGNEITSVTGLSAETQMVSINTKICFFPQKTYLSISRTALDPYYQINEYGNIDAQVTMSSSTGTTRPEVWETTDVCAIRNIPAPADIKAGDAIVIRGTATDKDDSSKKYIYDSTSSVATAHGDISCVVENVTEYTLSGSNYVTLTLPKKTFIEMTGGGTEKAWFVGSVKRTSPVLSHVIEWNNRLWGVSDEDNTVYACKLGDPTNWQYYQGTSLDSYYAQQGTDGKWTGAAAYSGHLIFFKENSMTKVYGTAPANFQVTNAVCFGVKENNEKSVAIINDTVFYNSSIGIMAYEGGTPYSISTKLNRDYTRVIAGTEGRKYYASCQYEADGGYQHELLVLDVDRAVWHREGEENIRQFANIAGKLIGVMEHSASDAMTKGVLMTVNPDTPNESLQYRSWSATFGPFDESVEDQKIFSKISLRFIVGENASATVYIKMDDGEWEQIREFPSTTIDTGGEVVRIVPRRCDRFSIKLSGTGEIEIKSLTRRFRRGSEVRYGHNVRSTT